MILRIIACALLGWLLGGLNGAILISRWKMHEDVRTKGSGNAGMTNFLRTYGGMATLLVILIDVGKTVAACLLAMSILPQDRELAKAITATAVQVGHIFPVFFGFRGGKGILCAGTAAAMLNWKLFLIGFALFLIAFFATRYVSLGSITAMTAMVILMIVGFWGKPQVWGVAIVMPLLAIFMHRENIARLLNGTERKTHFHKKKNREESQ